MGIVADWVLLDGEVCTWRQLGLQVHRGLTIDVGHDGSVWIAVDIVIFRAQCAILWRKGNET